MAISDTKIFISYASEDKESFVEPLARELRNKFFVWWDRYSLTMGDRLRQKIHEGLSECDYGVVVLSPAFFSKDWPQDELDGLLALETRNKKLILPVYKDIEHEEVKRHSLFLAERLGIKASRGIMEVVEEIQRAVEAGNRVSSFVGPEASKARFLALDRASDALLNSQRLFNSPEGFTIAVDSMKVAVESLRSILEEAKAQMTRMQIKITALSPATYGISVRGPQRLLLVVQWDQVASNSLYDATLRADFYREADPFRGDALKTLEGRKFIPKLNAADKSVLWVYNEKAFTPQQFADEVAAALAERMEEDFKRL